MSCCTITPVEWSRLQSDSLFGTVTLTVGGPINTQPVAVSLDGGTTWLDAEWLGDPGNTRDWQVYLTPDDLPDAMTVEVLVRVTDEDTDPEHPVHAIFDAGTITFT